jgi:hypothetical protein
VACVALLRAVGHVLDKVDSKRSPAHKRLISSLWSDLTSDRLSYPIFWDFIASERNSILKEYKFAVGGFTTDAIAYGSDHTNEPLDYDDLYFTDTLRIPYGMEDDEMNENGPVYAGEDIRDLVHEGIEFWQSRLNTLQSELLKKEQ